MGRHLLTLAIVTSLSLDASLAQACVGHAVADTDWSALAATISHWRIAALYPLTIAMLGALMLGRAMR